MATLQHDIAPRSSTVLDEIMADHLDEESAQNTAGPKASRKSLALVGVGLLIASLAFAIFFWAIGNGLLK